jgi:hypothetical protein
LEAVNDAISQRCLGPDDDEVNLLVLGCRYQRLNIGRADIEVLGSLSRAGITRSNVYFLNFRALGQLPDEGMLPSPTTNN